MAKADTMAARAPRGTKPVSQAFFTALEQIPEASRAAVAKSALTLIRDEMKTRREKLKLAAAKEKEKARKPAPAARKAKSAPAKSAAAPVATKPNGTAHAATPAKRRARKPSSVPTTA